jgi:hypothetical protein
MIEKLPAAVRSALAERGIVTIDEVTLRVAEAYACALLAMMPEL